MDVALLFLTKESMNIRKLNYLCYYAQAYHLALLNKPLFNEDFEAWIHGPTSPKLMNTYKKEYGINKIPKPNKINNNFNQDTMWVLENVKNTFMEYSEYELETLTKEEKPWIKARKGYDRIEHCNEKIKLKDMREYFLHFLEVDLECPNCSSIIENGVISGEYGTKINHCEQCHTDFILTTDDEIFIKKC